jgi:hypothetical protein
LSASTGVARVLLDVGRTAASEPESDNIRGGSFNINVMGGSCASRDDCGISKVVSRYRRRCANVPARLGLRRLWLAQDLGQSRPGPGFWPAESF